MYECGAHLTSDTNLCKGSQIWAGARALLDSVKLAPIEVAFLHSAGTLSVSIGENSSVLPCFVIILMSPYQKTRPMGSP